MSGEPWDAARWTKETRALRTALLTLGIKMPECLPGEPGDCTLPIAVHYGGYLAALKARCQVLIEANMPGDEVEHYAVQDYEHWVQEYRNELAGGPGGGQR